jgi:hypothetical protein
MGQKKIKRSKTSQPTVDPQLEEVGEERAAEIEYDDETDETIFVFHYRRKWGDDFDSDVEHGYTMEETRELVGVLMGILEESKRIAMQNAVEKSTPSVPEGNPLKENKIVD